MPVVLLRIMTDKHNGLYSVMKMLSFPSCLTLAPIKLIKRDADVFPTLQLSKYHQTWSFVFAFILSAIYFKVKVYDGLQVGKNFFIYIRSLSTFIEMACLVGNILCYSFGAKRTVAAYKKMKKMIKNNFSEADYKTMRQLYLIELIIPAVFLSMQCLVYCYYFWHPTTIILIVLDSNIVVLVTATCLRHYNIAIMIKICLDKLLKKFEGRTNLKQLQQIWSSYLEIYSIVKSSNEFFGIGLSCSLAVLYVYSLIGLFGICSFAKVFPSIAVANVFWFCCEMRKIVVVVLGTCSCEANARKLHAHLGFYKGEEDHLEEVNNIRCKLTGSKIKFSACGFFDTDASLLYKLIGSLLLNLTILLQFGKKFQK